MIDLDLTQAPTRKLLLAGRRQAITCRYAPVDLQLTDGRKTFAWSAIVGFLQARLPYPLLGHAGFLQFFNVEFQGAEQQVVINPNAKFSGRTL